MKTWFLGLNREKQIVWFVLCVHIVCVGWLWVNHVWSTKRTNAMFTVHTVRLVPAQRPQVVAQAPAVAAVSKPVVASKPVAGKPVKKTTKTKPAAKPTGVPAKPVVIPQPIVSEPVSVPAKPALAVPTLTLPVPVAIETPVEAGTASVTEMIGSFLRESLELPEFGEVKIKLSLDKTGRLMSLEILETKSAKNAEFLKNRLPELTFPWLNEETSVTIVFRNV